MKAFVESHGCSFNAADSEQLRAFLRHNGYSFSRAPEKARLLVLNTCAVKEATEFKMLNRIRKLNKIAERKKIPFVVFGCLPRINPEAIKQISDGIIRCGTSLEELAGALGLPVEEFSPALGQLRSNKFVSIIKIAQGCLGNCSFCATKKARGKLQSYSIPALQKKFKQDLRAGAKEFWLTAQDTGCYGFDKKTDLTELLEALLKNKESFRIRIGMMNPHFLGKILKKLLPLFQDKRLYRFFHVPLQSGSDAVLAKMLRPYKARDFAALVKAIRKKFPEAVVSTDIIVGFPGETEKDFKKTLAVLKKTVPDIVNVSRFGARPGTLAARMPGQLHGREKKKRSRIAAEYCRQLSLGRNRKFVGEIVEIFVSEKGTKGNFVGRAQNYKPIVVKDNLFGRFAKARVSGAHATFLFGDVVP